MIRRTGNNPLDHIITTGFTDAERPTIAALYWQAFGAKLHVPLGPEAKALAFLPAVLNPDFALVSRNAAGEVLGVAGFKTAEGAMVGGGMREIAAVYGWTGALWRGPLLAMVERDLEGDVLLMDGICVAKQARGLGVGTALLHAIKAQAAATGLTKVRLDVIDTNPRARALYEREGFEAVGVERLGPLERVFGFSSATKMVCELRAAAPA